MADSAASSTPRVSRPATARRRARAASPASDAPSVPAAPEPDTPAFAATGNEGDEAVGAAHRNAPHQRLQDARDEQPPAERVDVDLFGAMETLNLDPRQGTLAGFELSTDALDSLRARAAAERAAAETEDEPASESPFRATGAASSALQEHATREQVIPEPAGARIADIAAYLRVDDAGGANPSQPERSSRSRMQAAKRSWTPAPASASTSASTPASPSAPASAEAPASTAVDAAGLAQAASTAALTETVAALSRALSEERRAAAVSRRRAARLLAVMAFASVLVLALGIAQFVVLARVARDTAAAQEKTEALLRSQQLALAAFLDTASGAAADIRGTADALAAKLAALPSRQGIAQASSSSPASTQGSGARHSRGSHTHKGG